MEPGRTNARKGGYSVDLERSDALRFIALGTSHSRISWTRWDCSSDDRMDCYRTIDRTASVLSRDFPLDKRRSITKPLLPLEYKKSKTTKCWDLYSMFQQKQKNLLSHIWTLWFVNTRKKKETGLKKHKMKHPLKG